MKLAEQLERAKIVAISGHIRPDGDCVGSTLATYNYIRTYYPEITVDLYLEGIPNIFKFLTNADQIIDEYTDVKEYDLFIIQDCGDTERLGKYAPIFSAARRTFCVDHHVSNVGIADVNYIFPDVSSTSELIFELMEEERITREIAECIYVGMVHDTGVFQYESTTSKTMNIAGKLMDTGIDFTKIIDDTFYTKTFNQNRVLGQALVDSKLYLGGKCIVSQIDAAQMKEYDVLPKHLDGIVSQLRVTKDVEVAVFLYQTDEANFKVSMRSQKYVNVAEIAVKFGGGGHVRAAGATIAGTSQQIEEKIIEEIAKQLR